MGEEEKYISNEKLCKSYNFLWPLTGFGKWMDFKPEKTYCYWRDENIEDYKLISYFKESGNRFDDFEKNVILRKDQLSNCYKVKDGMVYVFDLVQWANDIGEFLEGRYSQFSGEAKAKILRYHNISNDRVIYPGRPVYMGLYPEYFFKAVAEELGENEEVLKSVGELIPKFKTEEETLVMDITLNCECVPTELKTL